MEGSARTTRLLHRTLGSACVAVLLGLGAAPNATAENAYWQGRRDAIWENGIDPLTRQSNWYTKPARGKAREPPDGNAIFAQGPLETNVLITGNTTVASLIVEQNDGVYTFAVKGFLDILGAGIFNYDPTAPRFTISRQLSMRNAARFFAGGTLKSALIKIRPRGVLVMFEKSSGGNAEVANTGGDVEFYDSTSADRMKITNAQTFSPDRGGRIRFFSHSTGGDARFVNLGGGYLDFSTTRGPLGNRIVTAGDIYNDGSINVGLNTLVVADNFVMGSGLGSHQLHIRVVGDRAGKVHVDGELTLGNSTELWVEGTDVDPGGYLVLRHDGARSGSLQLVTHLSAYLRYFTNEIYLIVN